MLALQRGARGDRVNLALQAIDRMLAVLDRPLEVRQALCGLGRGGDELVTALANACEVAVQDLRKPGLVARPDEDEIAPGRLVMKGRADDLEMGE